MKVKQAYKQTLIRCTMSASVDASVCILCHTLVLSPWTFYIYIYTNATTTQCKLQNMCSFVCVDISKCLVGRGKPPPVQVTVGSSRMDASHVWTLDNVLVGTRKTPPAQVADTVHSKCKLDLCAS